ncbi:MAG: hypothetical protein OXC41_03520 [Gammaproteobacteria bacterium]|nr:hypothetical protein [Gammaproteobacteria bacterium]
MTPYINPDADLPDDLMPMMRRAFKVWSRRIDGLIQPGNNHQGASHLEPGTDGKVSIDFIAGYTITTGCNVACTNHSGDTQFPPEGRSDTQPVFVLAQDYFGDLFGHNYFTEDGEMTVDGFKVLAHEFGHIFDYQARGQGVIDDNGNYVEYHRDCDGEGIMCHRGPYNEELIPVGPAQQDFDGITHHYSLKDPSDHEVFGIWASVQNANSNLNEFGVRVTRTLTTEQVPATQASRQQSINNVLEDRIRIESMISGTPSNGPVTGMGTATWSGDLIAVNTTQFRPVFGEAELSMDLANINLLEASFSNVRMAEDDGSFSASSETYFFSYTLMRHDTSYIDENGFIDANFYAVGTDDTGAVAGRLDDSTRNLMGAYGAIRE